MRYQKLFAAFLVLGLFFISIVAVSRSKPLEAQSGQQSITSSRFTGDPAAPLKIVEYLDYGCKQCAIGSEMVKEYTEKYPGQILLFVQFYPLSAHKHSYRAALYAECAARQDSFWPFHDAILSRQDEWTELENVQPYFNQIAGQLGLNLKDLGVCVEKPEVHKVVQADKASGEALGIRSTPTFFANNEMVVGPKMLRRYLQNYFKEAVSDGPDT